jgi:hypothetical protein
VTDRDVVAEDQGALIPHRVADAAVLEVRVLSYANDVAVATDDAVEPETGIIPDLDVTDDLSALRKKNALADLRSFALVLVQHPTPHLLAARCRACTRFRSFRKATTLAVFGDIINGCFA